MWCHNVRILFLQCRADSVCTSQCLSKEIILGCLFHDESHPHSHSTMSRHLPLSHCYPVPIRVHLCSKCLLKHSTVFPLVSQGNPSSDWLVPFCLKLCSLCCCGLFNVFSLDCVTIQPTFCTHYALFINFLTVGLCSPIIHDCYLVIYCSN